MKKTILIILLSVSMVLIAGCQTDNQITNSRSNIGDPDNTTTENNIYLGEKGIKIKLTNNQVLIDKQLFDDSTANFYNTEINGKTVYYFVVKDSNGIYRAAANACQVCHDARLGFRQVGNNMVCNTCGNAYPIEKIATEKGGCNPVPINPNLEVKGDKIIINEQDLRLILNYF